MGDKRVSSHWKWAEILLISSIIHGPRKPYLLPFPLKFGKLQSYSIWVNGLRKKQGMSGYAAFASKLKFFTKVVVYTAPLAVCATDIIGHLNGVVGLSMQPTLNPKPEHYRDVVFQNCWAARNYKFKRGDIVSFVSPINPDQFLIKRIVALEGDTVKTLSYKRRYVKVPPGHCWVEGDNHWRSNDSNQFGPIPVGLIYAKSTHIVWPPHRWKMLASTPEKHRIIGEDDSIAADADSELIEEILEMNVDISDTRVAKVKPVTWRPEIHGRR